MTFFILGHQPTLSVAEISKVLGIDLSQAQGNEEVLLIPEDLLHLPNLQSTLGGTIKMGWTIQEMDTWDEEELANTIVAYASNTAGKDKITFGLSLYDLQGKKIYADKMKALEKLGLTVKKILKETGRPVRFVSSKEPALSSVIVETNHLLSSGGEFVLFLDGSRILVGQTQSVQDFVAWSDRDYSRPARDAKSGMLPPKLARIMINLAGKDLSKSTLLDPFCGSGTILMEAALMQCHKLIGSDNSGKAIRDTQSNMTWLSKNYLGQESNCILIETPAEDLPKSFSEPVDMIITETYLGPPQKGRESFSELKQTLVEIEDMLTTSLASLKTLIKKDGVMILACPVYHIKEEWMFLPMQKITRSSGWSIQPFSDALEPLSPSGGLVYERPGQRVGREIIEIKPL